MKNWRTFSLVLWIVFTVISIFTMPNIDELVREKGQISLPETAQSVVAERLLASDEGEGEYYNLIAVHTSKTREQLNDRQKEEIVSFIDELKNRSDLGVSNVLSFVDNEQIEKQLFSEDQTTILTQFTVEKSQGEISDITEPLQEIINRDGVDAYLTGGDVVMEDFLQSTQEGVKKTEIIAVIFIIVILIAVFRSPIVPLISLITVGVSYFVSLAIVMNLVESFNFPFSNFTQVFLVVILFGIGTDYNILLYTRFKGELATSNEGTVTAIKATYKAAGKTVVYSGAAVLVGFVALYLAQFQLYQSMSAVAIGIAVLLLVLLTLNPFFMGVLGKKMFWPVQTFEGHSNSKLWSFLSKTAVYRPLLSFVFIGLLSTPFITMYSNELNYNDLLEVKDHYTSKQGIQVIEEHFPAGFSAPATVVLKTDERIDQQQGLEIIDQLTEKIAAVNGVESVYSPTRPAGEKIEELYINDQANVLHDGIGEATDGVNKIFDGLSSAENELGASDSGQLDDVQRLIDGTNEVKQGVTLVGEAIQQMTTGFQNGATGAEQLQTGLTELHRQLTSLKTATSELHKGYGELAIGLQQFSGKFDQIAKAIQGTKQGYEVIEQSMTAFVQMHPEYASDENIERVLGTASHAQQELLGLVQGINEMTAHYKGAMGSFTDANNALAQVLDGQTKLQEGARAVQKGSVELAQGLENGAKSSAQLNASTPALTTGLTQLADGQQALLNGLEDLSEKMGELQEGLAASTEGLDEIGGGLQEAQQYLGELSSSTSTEKLFIPDEVRDSEEFQEALDMYVSTNRQVAQLMVILEVNPYSKEAMDIIENIEEVVHSTLKGNALTNLEYAVGGKSAENADLQQIAGGDFTRTALLMLIGISIILLFITRSIFHSVYIVVSLVIAYYTSLGISEWIGSTFLGMDILSWNVPFFSFIMIVALGVDYSIFLMMRYNEQPLKTKDTIIEAASHIGGVVISAAIILGGTFAALIPSGVMTLVQVAMVVIIGLLWLSVVMLPIFVPALMGLQEKFTKKNKA